MESLRQLQKKLQSFPAMCNKAEGHFKNSKVLEKSSKKASELKLFRDHNSKVPARLKS